MSTVSIVTAVLNDRDGIVRTLRSVAAQLLGEAGQLESIIVDGGSTDGTTQRVRELRLWNSALLYGQDTGIYDGMNIGVLHSAGDVVGLLNAGDFYFHRDAVAKVAQTFADPTVDICHGNVVYVSADDPSKVIRVWRGGPATPARMRRGWMPPHPTFFVRRDCYLRYGLYREDMGTAADYELMLRFLVEEGLKSVYLRDFWVAMPTGGASNASLNARLRANRMDRRAWAVNGLRPSPLLRALKPIRKLPQYWRRGVSGLEAEIRRFLTEPDGESGGFSRSRRNNNRFRRK